MPPRSLIEQLRAASRPELRGRLAGGHPVEPGALEGWVYRGTSLGLPRLVERLTWKTFQKAFHRDGASGRLVGWNVRLEQDGVDAPSRPRLRRGAPLTQWYFEVTSDHGAQVPRRFRRGVLIDYARGRNSPLGAVRFTKDPLVAVEPGRPELLLGVSFLAFGRWWLETPTYFLLEREERVGFVPSRALAGAAA